MGTGARSDRWQVWIRRCRVCGTDDLRAVFGQRAAIDDLPWWCPSCGGTDWVAAHADAPVGT